MSDESSRSSAKATGRHFTPDALAAYVARLALRHLSARRLDVLDPACGDGALLEAVLNERVREQAAGLCLVGVDLDPKSLVAARRRLEGRPVRSLQLRQGDFLERWLPAESDAAGPERAPQRRFDLIVANPPYVRTQVLGADRSQDLARALGLSGRVDLYQAFVRAMTPSLKWKGVLALLCPNRFMMTRSGAAMRTLLLREYELLQIVDLGDTGLFSAAVLPAILIARRVGGGPRRAATPFVRIYRAPGAPAPRAASDPSSLLDALDGTAQGRVRISGRDYRIDRGETRLPEEGRSAWTLLSPSERSWTDQVLRHSVARFEQLVRIRVGVKTTADAVFIRDDWNSLPAGRRPEAELLRPLLTHLDAAPYAIRGRPVKTLLYPHTTRAGRRRPIDLSRYPRARNYFAEHRERLASRRYVREAGREWFELWVPHHPEDWSAPKIVVPDISAVPRFHLDRSGALVNGDCYWITLRPDQDPRLLLLILAVANSSLAVRYYDNICSNRLYSGRRRYITQHLNSFPVPDPDSAPALRITLLTQRRLDAPPESLETPGLEAEIDQLVARAFGVSEESSWTGPLPIL